MESQRRDKERGRLIVEKNKWQLMKWLKKIQNNDNNV